MNIEAASADKQFDPARNECSTRRSLTQKTDGLVALSMALGSMSADEIVSATSPWDDHEFKLAV